MQLVVSQQLDAALKMIGEHLHGEVRSGVLASANVIECLLECYAVEMLAAISEQPVEHLRDAFLARVLLGLGTIADVPEHAHRVTYISGLHDQRQTIRQGADERVQSRFGHLQALQSLAGPGGKRGRMRLTE